SAEQHADALTLAAGGGTRYGQALIDLRIVTATDLARHLATQTGHKVATALRWTTGTFAFTPDETLAEAAHAQAMDPAAEIPRWLRDSADLNDAADTCRRVGEKPLAMTALGTRHIEAWVAVFGAKLLRAIRRGATLSALLAEFESGAVFVAVETLVLSGCVAAAESVSAPVSVVANLETLASASSQAHAEPMPELDPGVVALSEVTSALERRTGASESGRARDELIAEHLRVQNKGLYTTLDVDHHTDAATILAAYERLSGTFAVERFAPYNLGEDYARLAEIHAAYRRAHDGLLDPEHRAAYDVTLRARTAPSTPFSTELEFRRAAQFLATGNHDAAVRAYQEVVHAQPSVAEYHAALGWALFERSKTRAWVDAREDQTLAFAQFEEARALDPEDAETQALYGRALAEIPGREEAALEQLGRALDAQPPRLDALEAFENVARTLGAADKAERRYRRLLHRIKLTDPALSLRLWLSLGNLYWRHLGDAPSARTAYECAAALDGSDPDIFRALDELNANDPTRFDARAHALVARWRLEREPRHGVALVDAAQELGKHDWVFLASSVLVARGHLDDRIGELYHRHR
ncbi:MAG: tetratricopeptide repeat protein, partial [Chloroflexota bacterium]